MDKGVLEGLLAEGMSLEQIGKRLERHPSTVGYWLRKHELAAVGRDAHASRGGIERERLAELVARGLSSREIAEDLGLSLGTVRHWLRRHDLRTLRAGVTSWTDAPARTRVEARCAVHGDTEFVVRRDGYLACCSCRAEAVSRWRRRVKATLVSESGGACVLCGYARSPAALHFHHLDPREKRFGIGGRGLGRSIETLRREAAKCVLLCANCHAEVESGHAELPATMTQPLLRSSGVAHDPG